MDFTTSHCAPLCSIVLITPNSYTFVIVLNRKDCNTLQRFLFHGFVIHSISMFRIAFHRTMFARSTLHCFIFNRFALRCIVF